MLGECKLPQITGVGPMLLEDITDVIKIMKEEGTDHVQMNTNGMRHAMDPEAAREVRLARCDNLHQKDLFLTLAIASLAIDFRLYSSCMM